MDEKHRHQVSSGDDEVFMKDEVERLEKTGEPHVEKLEQIKLENYSLRKRCKRLENIVSQLLENKGKTDESKCEVNDREKSEPSKNTKDIKIIASTFSSNYLPFVIHNNKQDKPPNCYIDKSTTTEHSHNHLKINKGFSAEVLAKTSISESVKCNDSPNDKLNIPKTANFIASKQYNHPKDDELTITRTERKNMKRKEPSSKLSQELTHKEIEKRNELFRENYYAAQTPNKSHQQDNRTHNSQQGGVSSKRTSPIQFLNPKKEYNKPRFHSLHNSTSQIPEGVCHTSSYYKNFHEENKVEKQKMLDEPNYKIRKRDGYFETYRMYDHELSNNNMKSKRYTHHSVERITSLYTSPSNVASSPTYPRHFQLSTDYRDSSSSSKHRPLRLSRVDDMDKYNSDFYTKLPPKLHIVESQNENGVTLTWNATSNCDSSLVKSYQLFARELFGHKVGTMKRIGEVNALPLPMSCNIDKLKYNIKYKFAVCAIDVYGRYGKMSNFTGKFELKPKGPLNETEKVTIDEVGDLEISV